MRKEIDKIIEALENISIKFDELGFSPTIPIPKGDKAHFVDWFKVEIDTIKAVSNQQYQRIAELEDQLKKSLESNNDLLKQIMELETQLIKERIKER